ncbi:peptidoglycan-associated lipoprotein Pal [Geomonas sp. Red32]|uniref:peptidoglycan-associated lipoprotein Pal n=1 Tax=Geomonas sp. Red32 TaxID=2912856 RepID=UPI00202CF7E2|nr:peptidoglycan-associated lipoprotein Pal [Geomonas sp. Red32]MCM0084007.1 peptidoglycan-associated lipoprotein Pal [Geomonas sp. Red32]
MRNRITGTIVFVFVGALLCGGCAKKEVVKPEETAPAAQAAPVTPAPAEQPKAAEQVKPAPRPPEPAPQVAETPAAEAPVSSEAPKAGAREQAPAGEAAGEMRMDLKTVYFAFDSSELSAETRDALSKNAEVLKMSPGMKIRIEGNCDERGSDEYNMALGERRAKSAKDYLVNLGIAPDRISVISYGEEKPVDQGHDEAAWSKNRRDDFVIAK